MGLRDFGEEAVCAKKANETSCGGSVALAKRRAGLTGREEDGAQVLILEAAQTELTPADGAEEVDVGWGKGIESPNPASLPGRGPAQVTGQVAQRSVG